MPTSGTYSFTVTRDDIINAALRSLSVLDQASTANSTDLANCGQALNILMKELVNIHPNLAILSNEYKGLRSKMLFSCSVCGHE